MEQKEIENIEIDLLLKAIYERYGYDFREYARASLKRRVRNCLDQANMQKITELTVRLLHDEDFFQSLEAAAFYLSLYKREVFGSGLLV